LGNKLSANVFESKPVAQKNVCACNMWNSLKESYTEQRKLEKMQYEEHNTKAKPISVHKAEQLKKHVGKLADQDTKTMFESYVKRNLLLESPDLRSTVTADICEDCGVQMMVIANDSMLACSRCAKTRVITSANAWSSSLDVDFSTINNHQKSRVLEWLEFAQAKEYGEIPLEICQQIMESIVACKGSGLEQYISIIANERDQRGPFLDATSSIQRLKEKIPNIEALLKSFDFILVRNYIRNTPAKKYAERSAKIAANLSGFLPQRLNADQEEFIRKLFMSASPVYDKWRKSNQPVWPGGYAYFLRCVMILLGWDEFAALFPIQMTGRNQEREEMRKAIWSVLQWENVPSTGPQTSVTLANGTVLDGSIIAEADSRCLFTARGFDEL